MVLEGNMAVIIGLLPAQLTRVALVDLDVARLDLAALLLLQHLGNVDQSPK